MLTTPPKKRVAVATELFLTRPHTGLCSASVSYCRFTAPISDLSIIWLCFKWFQILQGFDPVGWGFPQDCSQANTYFYSCLPNWSVKPKQPFPKSKPRKYILGCFCIHIKTVFLSFSSGNHCKHRSNYLCRDWSSHSPWPAEHSNSLARKWCRCLLAFQPYKSSPLPWRSFIRKCRVSALHLFNSLLMNSPTRMET